MRVFGARETAHSGTLDAPALAHSSTFLFCYRETRGGPLARQPRAAMLRTENVRILFSALYASAGSLRGSRSDG